MKIGLESKWLFARDFKEGEEIKGVFTGTAKVQTKNGQQECAVFVAGNGTEYRIFGSSLECSKTFEVADQLATLTRKGNKFIVELN